MNISRISYYRGSNERRYHGVRVLFICIYTTSVTDSKWEVVLVTQKWYRRGRKSTRRKLTVILYEEFTPNIEKHSSVETCTGIVYFGNVLTIFLIWLFKKTHYSSAVKREEAKCFLSLKISANNAQCWNVGQISLCAARVILRFFKYEHIFKILFWSAMCVFRLIELNYKFYVCMKCHLYH